jgi:hypothetical protein
MRLDTLEVARHEPVRNRLMLALAYDAALRREELCSLQTSDLDPAHRTVRVRAETTTNRRERVVPYSAATGEVLSGYLAHRSGISRARGPLFLSESRRKHAQPLTLWTRSKVARQIALHPDAHLRRRTGGGVPVSAPLAAAAAGGDGRWRWPIDPRSYDTTHRRRAMLDASAVVLLQCAQTGRSYWAWTDKEWAALLGRDQDGFRKAAPLHAMQRAVAHLGFCDPPDPRAGRSNPSARSDSRTARADPSSSNRRVPVRQAMNARCLLTSAVLGGHVRCCQGAPTTRELLA